MMCDLAGERCTATLLETGKVPSWAKTMQKEPMS